MLRPSSLQPVLRNPCRVARQAAIRRHAAPACRRTFLTSKDSSRATQEFDLNKLGAKRRDYENNRMAFLTAGAIAGVVSFIYTAYKLKNAVSAENEKKRKKEEGIDVEGDKKDSNTIQCDSNIPNEQFKTEAGEKRKVVVHDDEGNEIVPTGNSVVPAFPLVMDVRLPHQQDDKPADPIAASISDNEGTAFTLVGLGTRTVTFLGIQVYVVGFYVATQDVEILQHYLVKKVNPLATTLIPSEKEALKKSLLDPVEGEETWESILRDSGVRSMFRIAPVKDTDFHHLRDGFVRSITGRSQRDNKQFGDEQFGEALKNFKGLFNRGTVPKKRELLLCRDGQGRLSVMYNPKEGRGKKEVMGVVEDERISRLLWLNYLAGSKVASEGARQNIITGVMEFVERPVGTVATQVI
jgi:hypothetical protein